MAHLDKEDLKKYWDKQIPGAGEIFYNLMDVESWVADRLMMIGDTSWKDDPQIMERLERMAQTLYEGSPRLIQDLLSESMDRISNFVQLMGYLSTIRSLRIMELSGVGKEMLSMMLAIAEEESSKDDGSNVFLHRMIFLDQIRFLDQFFDAQAIDESAMAMLEVEEEE